jgi:ribosomal protein S21
MRVRVKNNNVESAIRTLKRKMKDPLNDLREKEFYTKPSLKRNKAKQAARIRERKRQKDANTKKR